MRQLLKKASVNRLDFLKLVLMKKRIATQELADLGGFSRAMVRRLVSELNNDFYEAFGSRSTIIRQEDNNTYSIISDFSPNRLFHAMKLHYLQRTPQFNVLYAVATAKTERTIDDLCEEFELSTSYIHQVIREINKIISGYQVSLTRKDEVKVVLEGEEKYIRLLIYVLFFNSYQGLDHSFTYENREAVMFIQSMDLSPSEKEQLLLIFSIVHLRLSQGQVIQPMSAESAEILDRMHVSHEILSFQKEFLWQLLEDEEAVQTENRYLRLMIRVFVYSYESSKQKMLLGKQFTLMENDLTHFCQDVFWNVFETYHVHMEEEQYYESFFYFILLHVFLEVFPLNLDEILILNFSHHALNLDVNEESITEIKEFYKNYMYEYFPQFAEKFQTAQRFYIATQLHTMMRLPKVAAVKVFIHYSQNFLGDMLIRKRLGQMFNEEILQITTDIKQADMILSDSIEYDENQADYFLLYDATSRLVWTQLYRYLQKKITQKMFQIGDKQPLEGLRLSALLSDAEELEN